MTEPSVLVRRSLVSAARAGDRDAFERLLELEARTALGLCFSILRSPSDAEDAAQEAFVRAWRNLPYLADPDCWPGWFRRLTVTAAIDYRRRHRNGQFVPLGDHEPPPQPDPQHDVALRDETRRLIAGLEPRDRALLVLRYEYDLELPDVADALGVPLGTAKSRLHRVLARLRTDMENRDGRRRPRS